MSEYYVEVKKENIKFAGKTEEEKKLNEMIYDLTLENDALYEENKSLKEKLDIAETNYDIAYGYMSMVCEILDTELIEDAVNEILKLKRNNNTLIEFEKWLEEDFKNETEHPTPQIYCNCYSCKIKALNKLQELKEVQNETNNNI